ncbi:MAG: hypothetical protein O3C21_14685, partial [Verrucomicrobia bacterium]|nr:hypothetical protein [Verrucomicrobiota bacterium]
PTKLPEEPDYLCSSGWIIARKLLQLPANAPEQSRNVFRSFLGSLFAPYASKTADGSVQISKPKMATFYRELTAQIGAHSIDIPNPEGRAGKNSE